MFNGIIVILEGRSRVVGRINVDALDFAGELLFEGFEGEEVVEEIGGFGLNCQVATVLYLFRLLGVLGVFGILGAYSFPCLHFRLSQRCPPFVGKTIFLQTASWFVWNCHFDKAIFQCRMNIRFPEPSPAL